MQASAIDFWADQAALEASQGRQKFVVATGITPSGEIHIGNLREVVTADVVARALKARGLDVSFIYIADTYDPLRRVYPFLEASIYEAHVGRPLSDIPAPKGDAPSYAEHFLRPFLRSLEALDIPAQVLRADVLYKEGRYTENVLRALEHKDLIRSILKEETGKETDAQWSPFNPICEKDGKMTATRVLSFDGRAKTITYACECGHQGERLIAGGGKLTWRVDWPARWQMLGVTVEPFGKDHASAGGSYDTGKRIVKEVFNYEAPYPIVYEWISLRGGGDMSSSKGNVLSVAEMIEVVPPEVLKYQIIKTKPAKSLVFDPGLPLLNLVDEFDDPESKQRHARAAELALSPKFKPVGVPFRHVVTLVQSSQGNIDLIKQALERNSYHVGSAEALASRVAYAQRWIDRFGPEDIKFTLQPTLPQGVQALSQKQKQALALLESKLAVGQDAQVIHNLVYETKEALAMTPNELFEAIYVSLLGKPKGPRAGFFLATLDMNFIKARFKEASA